MLHHCISFERTSFWGGTHDAVISFDKLEGTDDFEESHDARRLIWRSRSSAVEQVIEPVPPTSALVLITPS